MTPDRARSLMALFLDVLADEAAPGRPTLEPPLPAPNPEWLWLSPAEDAAVRALAQAGGWLTAEQIAEKVGEPLNSRLRVLLGNLVERKVLESDTRRGYRLNAP